MPSGDNRRRPFPCPDCGGPSRIGNNYDTRIDGVAGRSTYRFCKVCGAKFRTFLPFGDPPENEREIPMTGRGLYPRSRPAEKEPEPEPPPAPPPVDDIHQLARRVLALRLKYRQTGNRTIKRQALQAYKALVDEIEFNDSLISDVTLEEIGITGEVPEDEPEPVKAGQRIRREKTVLTQNPGMI